MGGWKTGRACDGGFIRHVIARALDRRRRWWWRVARVGKLALKRTSAGGNGRQRRTESVEVNNEVGGTNARR